VRKAKAETNKACAELEALLGLLRKK
jgi:hypothetical protein